MGSEKYRKRKESIISDLHDISDEMENGAEESKRVADVVQNTEIILDDLDEQFRKKTGLTGTDVVFLFIAIGLQLTRQYVFSSDKFRLNDKQGDKLMEDALSLAPPQWQDVLTQSVPYDAIKTGTHINESTGLAGTTHRYRTLGHDPLLGWVFGTANIMTNSLTKTDLETYQVKDMTIVRHYPLGAAGMLERAVKYGTEDPVLFASSIARQAIHFGSDYFTKQGLPIPVIATVNDQLAQDMMRKFHIDLFSVTRSATLATFINNLIFLIHGLFNDGTTERERKLYEVRTRKILSYSNLVASSANVAYVVATDDFSKLDIGGMAVTIYRLITDSRFIKQVKEDFIFGSYREMIMGDDI